MKRILLALVCLLTCAFGLSAHAQNTTAVTASHIEDASQETLPSGTACFQAMVQGSGPPVAATGFSVGGGGLVYGTPVCRTVTNGVLSGLSLASSDHTSPVGVQYQITITDNNTGESWVLGFANITGTSWSLDTFVPSNVNTLSAAGPSFISGPLTANGPITAPYFHGVADSALLAGSWAASPQGCPNGEFSPTYDIHGNALNCQLPNGQTSTGSVAGTVALNPTGNQMVNQPIGTFMRFGSSSSTYTQIAYDGTVHAFSMIEKAPRVNILHPDFGTNATCPNSADPTGTIDSACSINAALSYIASKQQSNSSQMCLAIPAGTYLLNAELRVPPGVHICGDGPGQTFLKVTNQWQNAITLLNGVATGAPGGQDNNTLLEGFTIQGNGHLTRGTAIEFLSADRGAIKDVSVANWGGRGFNMWGDTERWNMINVRFSRVRLPIMTNFQTNEDHWFGLFIDDAGDTDDGYVYNRNAVNGVLPGPNLQAPVGATWQPNTQYHGGDFINDGTTNCNGGPCNQRATVDFTSGSSITFTGGDGTTTNDGTAPLNGSWLNVSNRTQWLPDYHCAAVFNGNANDIWGGSIKPNRSLCSIQWGGTNGEIHDMYLEASFGGSPLVNAAIQAGGMAEKMTLTSAITATQNTIPLSSTDWIPNFLTNVIDANGSIGTSSNYGFHIMCADAAPGSTNACAAHPSIQQGQSEFVTCGVASSDGSLHQCQRCASGSSVGCTAGTGFAWSSGDIVTSPTAGSPSGAVTVYNSHFTTPFNPTNSTGYISACNQYTVGGYSCGTIIAGGVIDGLELTRPFTDHAGFSGSNIHESIVLQDNRFNACCSVVDGIGLIDVPFDGSVTVRESADIAAPYPIDANSIMYAANGQPVGYKSGQGFLVNFGQYPGGNASGVFSQPEDGVTFSPNNNYFMASFRATNATETLAGASVNPGYCYYDVALKGAASSHPNGRWCFHSGTATVSAYTGMDFWNGTGWVSAWTLDGMGLHQSPQGGVGFGTTANFVQNSVNLSGTGWTGVSGGPSSITGGQADPTSLAGATSGNATKIGFPSSGANIGLTNMTTLTLTAGATYTACMWARTDNPGLVLNWGVPTSNNVLPLNTSQPLTTTWQRLQMSGAIFGTTQPLRFGVATASGQDVYIYDPLVWAGNGCPTDLPTTTPVQTPIPVVNVGNGEVIANGTPLIGASSATPTGTCTANGYVTANINGTTVHLATCN